MKFTIIMYKIKQSGHLGWTVNEIFIPGVGKKKNESFTAELKLFSLEFST